jgi:hypothetical protein
MRTKKTTPRQTSDRVSRIAAKWLDRLKGASDLVIEYRKRGTLYSRVVKADLSDLRALAASCLSQDQTKGPRVTKRRGRR